MASVKERAAALNLAEKLCLRPRGHGMASKPFQACIWNSVIDNLRTTVKVKKRLIHLKLHNDCFVGSEAVDVVSSHILHSRFFEGADILRVKVVRVCQALLDCKVFEGVDTNVFGKEKKHQEVFHDSKSCLYRFLNQQNPTVEELERVLNPGIQTTFCCKLKPSKEADTDLIPSTPVSHSQPLETLMEDVSPSKGHAKSTLPQSLVDEVWQEQTMLRLLQLLELPLLESLLESRENPSPHRLAQSNPDLIYTSNYLDREVLRAFRDSQNDAWLSAALDCLDFLPDQQVVQVSRELPRCVGPEVGIIDHGEPDHEGQPRCPSTVQCRLILWDTLMKYYSHPDHMALLSNNMLDIYTGVTDLLVNGRLDRALEAMQLCLKLLQPQRREELQRLLHFMTLATDSQELRLDKEVENRMVVKRTFSRAIIHNRCLSKEKVDLLVLFMMDNLQDIFMIPGALHKLVSDKISSLIHGTQPDVTGSTFCQQVSVATYQASSATTNELWALLKSIQEDPGLSTKKRKRLFGQFYQGHPEIFVQYFGDSVSTLL